MGNYFFRGIIIGLLFGVPVGAVGAMTAQRTLRYGMKAGLLTGLGSSAADCLYACVGVFGLTIISDFLFQYQGVLHLAGGCLILVMGIKLLKATYGKSDDTEYPTAGVKMLLASFVVGMTNPAAILTFLFAFSWFGIGGTVSIVQGIGLVCGVFIGTYIWWGTLSGVVVAFKKRAKESHLPILNRIFGVLLILFGAVVLTACGNQAAAEEEAVPVTPSAPKLMEEIQVGAVERQGQEMMIEVGGQSFRAILYENETVQALQELLPMTIRMDELHGNEKYYYLDEQLPSDAKPVDSIHKGDIMLFGTDCLVLFFEDLSNSYSYTKIGYIEDSEAFADALEGGTVEVSFKEGNERRK